MSEDFKENKFPSRCSERMYRKIRLTIHRLIYIQEKTIKSHKIETCDSSKELIRINAEMFGEANQELLPSSSSANISKIMNATLTTGNVTQRYKQALVKPLPNMSNLDPHCLKAQYPLSTL